VIGVLRAHQGRGVGRNLLAAVRSWAGEHGIARLELTVRADNAPARTLYERACFVEEGIRRASLRVGHDLIDEVAMACVLDRDTDSATSTLGDIRVRALRADEQPWLEEQLIRLWGSPKVLSRGRVHDASRLPALVCEAAGGPRGLATYDFHDRECELVTLDAFTQGQGAGSALLAAVIEAARQNCCRRLWLITSNDNLRAVRFYQRRGLRLVAVYRGAIDGSRRIKPEIPFIGDHGIPLHDELELELPLVHD
jgi:ribosomal protein S18 acetylase RimI-like enzyme